MRITLILLLSLFSVSSVYAVVLTGIVGNNEYSYTGDEIQKSASYSVKGRADYIKITELYPYQPLADGPVYSYTVDISGMKPVVRFFKSAGFGPVSYFIKLSGPSLNPKVIIKNNGNAAPVIASVSGVEKKDLINEEKRDSFIISGLIPPVYPDLGGLEPPAKELSENLPEFPEKYNISKGISTEMRYPNTPDNVLKDIADAFYVLHNKYGLKIIFGMVSWWSGTPIFVKDPDGIPFGDEKYQQICYSPSLEFPYSDKLQKLLGDRYNTHYTSTQPNQWANTPWLTMNSDTLFAFRKDKLKNAMEIIKRASGSTDWIECFYMENEPKYYDQVLDRNGAYGERLWADFNPLTVRAALEEGVTLDPRDGMSGEELLWLHKNVADYNTESARMYNGIMKSLGFSQRLYSHSLYQGRDVFPCNMLKGKPASEWAVSTACLTGLESCGIPMLPSDIYRIREYGKWTNLNREENDGMPLDFHIYDLRLCYMMGGDYYNSYNWHGIGEGRFAGYTNKFAKNFPYVWESPQDVKQPAGDTLSICLPYSLLSFTDLKIKMQFSGNQSRYTASITDPGGNLIAQKEIKPAKEEKEITISFPTMLECEMNKNILLSVPGAKLSADGVKVGLDIHEQRLLSLNIINAVKK